MPDSKQPDKEREARITRLVAADHMTHEKAGQYTADHVSKRATNSIPDYDKEMVMRAFPNALELKFDEDSDGCFVIIHDGFQVAGNGDADTRDVRIPLGKNPPKNTDALIKCIHAYYRGSLNTDALNKTAALFDAMDED